MKENSLIAKVVCFQMPEFETTAEVSNSNVFYTYMYFIWEITFFHINYGTSDWAVSHKVLYNKQLSIARC